MYITYSVMNTLLESFVLIPLGSLKNSLPTEVKTLSSNKLYNALGIAAYVTATTAIPTAVAVDLTSRRRKLVSSAS
jgi:hypothetical protein